MNKCSNCEKFIAEKDKLMKSADSIFDIVEDMKAFEEKCLKSCPKCKKEEKKNLI